MKSSSFNLSNENYCYRTIHEFLKIPAKQYYTIFQYTGKSIVKFENEEYELKDKDFLEFVPQEDTNIFVNSGYCVLLSKSIDNNCRNSGVLNFGNIINNSYKVTKPWGCEYWITGLKPINNVVLKYIQVNAGTKTSVQVHMQKYESNFVASGKAVFRTSPEIFSIKKEYDLESLNINSPKVLDVSPLTIHQVEAVTDVELIEASTNHLDDVIRLKDDSGRSDGKIDSEHLKKN